MADLISKFFNVTVLLNNRLVPYLRLVPIWEILDPPLSRSNPHVSSVTSSLSLYNSPEKLWEKCDSVKLRTYRKY